ncbi:antitoxin ChpS [Buttiauxella izardii]|uniref:Antitoxin ChpS n=1 Tax=Buttiauxella izardii TaxID=82991 RepID=A0A3A5JKC4_9ENTR|nr:antitoxin ChpS [Buttiauxella izardii]RJT18736.1 antitoxin ChpS [Buttiauxella izardii]
MDIPGTAIGKSEPQVKRNAQRESGRTEPAPRRYTLDELLAQCDMNAPVVTEEEVWGNLRPVGKEIW